MGLEVVTVCDKCKLFHHLCQNVASFYSFGYGMNDRVGREYAANFLLTHIAECGNIRVVRANDIPDGYKDAGDKE